MQEKHIGLRNLPTAMPRKARDALIAAGFSSGDISVLLPDTRSSRELRMRPMRRTLRSGRE